MSLAIRHGHPSGPAYWLEQIGRATMDFGFAGLLNKFEEHFGRRATKCFLVIVGLAVTAVSFNLLWNKLVHPLLKAIDSAKPVYWSWEAIFQTGFYTLEVAACAGFASTVVDAYRNRIATEQIEDYAGRAEAVLAEAITARAEGKELIAEALASVQKATKAFDKVADYTTAFDLALDNLLACADQGIQPTPETIELLRSIQDIVREKRP